MCSRGANVDLEHVYSAVQGILKILRYYEPRATPQRSRAAARASRAWSRHSSANSNTCTACKREATGPAGGTSARGEKESRATEARASPRDALSSRNLCSERRISLSARLSAHSLGSLVRGLKSSSVGGLNPGPGQCLLRPPRETDRQRLPLLVELGLGRLGVPMLLDLDQHG